MATFTDASAFANHIKSYGKAVESAQKEAVAVTAKVAAEIVKTSGSRYHIKGRRGKGATLGAKVLPGSGGSSTAIVQATPAGAWTLIEQGAKPHEIGPRRKGSKGRRAAVAVPGLGVFARVHHPGTGSIGHPWEQAMTAVQSKCPDVYADAVVAGTLSKVI